MCFLLEKLTVGAVNYNAAHGLLWFVLPFILHILALLHMYLTANEEKQKMKAFLSILCSLQVFLAECAGPLIIYLMFYFRLPFIYSPKYDFTTSKHWVVQWVSAPLCFSGICLRCRVPGFAQMPQHDKHSWSISLWWPWVRAKYNGLYSSQLNM